MSVCYLTFYGLGTHGSPVPFHRLQTFILIPDCSVGITAMLACLFCPNVSDLAVLSHALHSPKIFFNEQLPLLKSIPSSWAVESICRKMGEWI